MRRKGFWTLKIQAGLSWAVRKILKSTVAIAEFFRYHVGVDSSFLLWHDPWLTNSAPLSLFDTRIIYILRSHSMARISTIIQNNQWNLHPSYHMFSMVLRDIVDNVPLCYTI